MSTAKVSRPPPNYAGTGFLAEYWTLVGFAVVFTALRVYVSIQITRFFDWADYNIYIALAFLIVAAALATKQVQSGLGQHISDIEHVENHTLQLRKWTQYAEIFIVLVTLFTKYSIGMFILRIRNDRRVKVFIGIILLLITLATLATVIMVGIACVPLEALWDPKVNGTCLPLATDYIVSYVQSGFTIVTDLAFTASPIVILWNVKISRRRKILIISLMSLGLIATVSNAIRNAFVWTLTSPDFTYNVIWISILSPLETCSGIIAACAPACAPIITRRRSLQTYNTANSARSMLPQKDTTASVELNERWTFNRQSMEEPEESS